VECPAITFADCWTLIEKLNSSPNAAHARQLIWDENYRKLPALLQDFAYDYEYSYAYISKLPTPPVSSPWLLDIWNIIRCAIIELG